MLRVLGILDKSFRTGKTTLLINKTKHLQISQTNPQVMQHAPKTLISKNGATRATGGIRIGDPDSERRIMLGKVQYSGKGGRLVVSEAFSDLGGYMKMKRALSREGER